MRRVHTLLPPLLLIALLFMPSTGFAQQQNPGAAGREPIKVPGDGFELFRALLDRAGIKPITGRELDSGGIGLWFDVIVIVVGDQSNRRMQGNPTDYANTAINSGGSAFIASHNFLPLGFAWRANFAAQDWAQIESALVECKDAKAVHSVKFDDGKVESKPWCPYVVPLTKDNDTKGLDSKNPLAKLFAGLDHVATNEPSYLHVSGFSGQFRYALARFPDHSVLNQNRNDNLRDARPLPPDALFAVGGYGPDGNNGWPYEFLAMADHSVFINQMLIEPGTDNLELAYRTIDYLQGPNKRKRCLFIENGRAIEKFDELAQAFKQSRPSPHPDLGKMQESLTKFGNAMAKRLETSNIPNKLLLGLFSLPAIMRFVLFVVAISATWYLMRRMFASRKPTDIPPPPTVAAAATGPPGVFERRQKELIRRDNLYEPVRDLVRDYFASVGIHGTRQSPKLPKLVISDEIRKPDALRLAIKDFWKLAYGPPQEVTVSRWRDLEQYFERLQQAHADGKWRFVLADAPVAVTV